MDQERCKHLIVAILLWMTGVVVADDPIRSLTGEWPTMRGRDGSGASDSTLSLIRDPSKVKLLWKSEEQGIPGGYIWPHKHRSRGISGGFSGPVVAEGVVVIVYYIPSGSVYDVEGLKKSQEMGVDKPREWLERKWSIHADDVVLCIDAETGKTRWKQRFKEKGLSHAYETAGPLLTPCITSGRVYALGSAGRVYCMDIRSGEVLWETSDWAGGRRLESVRKTCIEKQEAPRFHQNSYCLCSGPIVADGVVAINDSCGNWRKRENHGMAGLDAKTGKLMWHVADCMGGVTSPIPWVHKGKTYFIAAAPDRLSCIIAATGKLAWDYRGHVNKLGTPAISGDRIICAGTGGKFSPRRDFKSPEKQGIACFKMNAKGATKSWSLDEKKSGSWASPVIYKGHAYAIADKSILCIDVATGDIQSSVRFKYGGFYSSPLISDDRMIFRTTLYDADPKAFRSLGGLVVGRNRVQLEVFTTPAIADGKLYLRAPVQGTSRYGQKASGPGCIYCYDLREAG